MPIVAVAVATIGSTEFNSLANNTGATGTEQAADVAPFGEVEIVFATGANATAGNLVKLYWLTATDGTNYDDMSTPANVAAAQYVGAVVCRAATSHRLKLIGVALPVGVKYKPMLRNESGQAFSASGNTVKLLAYRFT